MMLPEPPRTKGPMQSDITSSFDVAQLAYEDPEEPVPAVTDESPPEVKKKPVPLPRSKLQPNSHCNTNNNTVYYADTTISTANVVSSELGKLSSDDKKPRPPRPPLSKTMISRKPTIDTGNLYMTSTSLATSPPETTQSPPPPRPEHPPPSSISYSRSPTMRLKSESSSEESEQSSCSYFSSMPQSPVSPVFSKEEMILCGSSSKMAADGTERPAVPPRPGRSSLCGSASLSGTSPTQTRPPPPSFTPPPPPSPEEQLDSVYSIPTAVRPYLDVLPEDVDKMSLGKPSVRYQTGFSPQPQTSEDAEDINGMLRWLKKVSKTDFMALSVYGLSIEEEIRTFSERAMNVRKALRLYNLLMMKRNESLRNAITELTSISDNLDKMKKKGKNMNIAGGTTGAVGGMTAVLGIAFAPVTLGASLIATVIGAGMVASAGGMGAHTAKANKKLVNRMTVEKLVYDYKANVVDLEHCLGFILDGMNELQRHDIARLQRAGAQLDSVKTAHLSQFVFQNSINRNRGTSLAYIRGTSSEKLLLAFVKEMDLYFKEKDDQKLKKSTKSKFSGRVRLLAENLQEELNHLNHMWERFG